MRANSYICPFSKWVRKVWVLGNKIYNSISIRRHRKDEFIIFHGHEIRCIIHR